jgi:hypothetical protein
LDYGVIVTLAGTEKGERFRTALIAAGGTLYLSWAQFLELFGLGAGPTFDRISNYLKSFGLSFAIIDADPNSVIRREEHWHPGLQNPAIDKDFIDLIVPNWDAQSEITVRILLDALKKGRRTFRRYQNDACHLQGQYKSPFR